MGPILGRGAILARESLGPQNPPKMLASKSGNQVLQKKLGWTPLMFVSWIDCSRYVNISLVYKVGTLRFKFKFSNLVNVWQ